MQFTIVYKEDTTIDVHKCGCRDLKKERNYNAKTVEAPSIKEAIAKELEGELTELGHTADDFRVLPCAHEAK